MLGRHILRPRVFEGGFPMVDAPQVELAFAQIMDGIEGDIGKVKATIPKNQRELRDNILKEARDLLKRTEQWTYNEREFAVRVLAQERRFRGHNETYSERILPFAEQAPGRNMLEIGFGDGVSFPFFNGWNYLGLEASSYAIWKARQKESLDGKKLRKTKNGRKFPVNNGSIDFILAYNSMHAIESWEFELDECSRVLSNSGRIYVVERIGAKRELNLPNINKFDRDYNEPKQIAGYLSKRGFNVEIENHFGSYFGEALITDGFFSFQHVKAVKS